MLAIKAAPDYMGNSGGEGALWQRTPLGEVLKVSIVSKLAMLAVIKFSTMDPMGMGVEMEGGKPGWNDAMNGLPGKGGVVRVVVVYSGGGVVVVRVVV